MYCHGSGWRAPRRSLCPACAVWLDVLQGPVSYNGHQLVIYWWRKAVFFIVYVNTARFVYFPSLQLCRILCHLIKVLSERWAFSRSAVSLHKNCEQGGTIAEHPAHRPRMSHLCADRTRRCLFFLPCLPFPSSPSSFLCLSQKVICTAAQAHLLFTSRLRHKRSFHFLTTFTRNTNIAASVGKELRVVKQSCLYLFLLFLLPALG